MHPRDGCPGSLQAQSLGSACTGESCTGHGCCWPRSPGELCLCSSQAGFVKSRRKAEQPRLNGVKLPRRSTKALCVSLGGQNKQARAQNGEGQREKRSAQVCWTLEAAGEVLGCSSGWREGGGGAKPSWFMLMLNCFRFNSNMQLCAIMQLHIQLQLCKCAAATRQPTQEKGN